MVTRRTAEPPRIRITTAVSMTAVSALVAVLGAWYAQKADVATAIAAIARQEARIEKLEMSGTQSDKIVAVIIEQTKEMNARMSEMNGHLERIEDRQVKVIMPAVTGNRNNH